MASRNRADDQAAVVVHPGETPTPADGEPVVRGFHVNYKQTWQPQSFDSVTVEVGFHVDLGDGATVEVARELATGYTGQAQAAVWEVAIPVLERTGRIPHPSVLNRIAGSDLEKLRWAKDTTGIPIEFRRKLGERLAATAKISRGSSLDTAFMVEGADDPEGSQPGQVRGAA